MRLTVTGSTRLAGVIGWPVRHSLSPVIHNAAYAATGLDWVYAAFPVETGRVPAALEGLRALDLAGLSVTMPHKAAAAAAVDRCSADAVALGAVNTVTPEDGVLVGDNTDGGGLVDTLCLDEGLDLSGMRTVVVGAGGAARAAVRALSLAGVDQVAVCNRTESRAVAAAALAGAVGSVGDVAAIGTADLIVQATPVGMGTSDELAFDVSALADEAVVVDLVYDPVRTPVLAAAEARGLRTVDGLGMLVRQAARQFTRWTGVDAPVDVMRAAVADRLATVRGPAAGSDSD